MTDEQMAELLKFVKAIEGHLDSLSQSTYELNANLELLMGETDRGTHYLRIIDLNRE